MQRLADTRCLHSFHSLTSLRRSPTKHDAKKTARSNNRIYAVMLHAIVLLWSIPPRKSSDRRQIILYMRRKNPTRQPERGRCGTGSSASYRQGKRGGQAPLWKPFLPFCFGFLPMSCRDTRTLHSARNEGRSALLQAPSARAAPDPLRRPENRSHRPNRSRGSHTHFR